MAVFVDVGVPGPARDGAGATDGALSNDEDDAPCLDDGCVALGMAGERNGGVVDGPAGDGCPIRVGGSSGGATPGVFAGAFCGVAGEGAA